MGTFPFRDLLIADGNDGHIRIVVILGVSGHHADFVALLQLAAEGTHGEIGFNVVGKILAENDIEDLHLLDV